MLMDINTNTYTGAIFSDIQTTYNLLIRLLKFILGTVMLCSQNIAG